MFHYTDNQGWKALRPQETWTFKATQPKDPDRPAGAYFTDIEPSKENLHVLPRRCRSDCAISTPSPG